MYEIAGELFEVPFSRLLEEHGGFRPPGLPAADDTMSVSRRIRGDPIAAYGSPLDSKIVVNTTALKALYRHDLYEVTKALKRDSYWPKPPSQIEPKWGLG